MLTQEMVADAPLDPGVYFFRGASGQILYIGKAKCLRKRVRSYLHKVKKRPNKIKRLIRWTTDVRYQTCRSEQEALFLESRLIQEYQPSYNTALKSGRTFWYIRIDVGEAFPRLERVSDTEPDGARYRPAWTTAVHRVCRRTPGGTLRARGRARPRRPGRRRRLRPRDGARAAPIE